MLQRIESIDGVGLFAASRGAAHKLEQTAFIYAGNGRGKTTLTSVLRSAGTGDASFVEDRRTIDGTADPKVTLQFDNGLRVKYENGAWSETRSEIRVFDTNFIENNVFSGGEVTSEHRRNLLNFALGDRAVAAQRSEEKAVADQQTASAKIKTITAALSIHAGPLPLPVFRALAVEQDPENKIAALSKRLADATRSGAIAAQPAPAVFQIPTIDLERFWAVLNRTLTDLHAEAEQIVSAHIESLDSPSAASWLSQGQQFDNHDTCPYCAQSTSDVPLIKMYQSHFNDAYLSLKSSITEAAALVDRSTLPSIAEELAHQRSRANQILEPWAALVEVGPLGQELDDLAVTSLANLRDLLEELFSRKAAAPTDEIGSDDELEEAHRLWDQFVGVYSDENEVVSSYIEKIEAFKANLLSDSIEKIGEELRNANMAVTRHSADVKALFQELSTAETALKTAELAKREARANLTTVMTRTLTKYRSDINNYLRNLGAAFAIDEIRTNFLGSSPRSDYGITLRGKSVKLNGGKPSFATALSEGDKRTLAFAFFVASTLDDPNASDKIIVIDDPVSSLDRSRREYTTDLLVQMSEKALQLILLAHDANFLRDTRVKFQKRQPPTRISTTQIQRTAGDYSDFSAIDLDRECETPYYTNYRMVDEFVTGKHNDARAAATALRPLLEGYLHRRFPGKLSSSSMLGAAISEIDGAVLPNPLVHMQNSIPELRDLNSFAGNFHHDTNPGYASHIADPTSIATFGQRVLDVLHGA